MESKRTDRRQVVLNANPVANSSATERERLSAILQASPDIIFVVDAVQFRLLAFNRSFEDLTLNTRRTRVRAGMRLQDIHPAQAEWWEELFRRTLEQGSATQEYRLSGVEIHQVSAQPFNLRGGANEICVFERDVTDLKRTEAALRQSEEKFSKAFGESPSMLALTSIRDGRYIEVNKSFLEATGYTREEVLGKTSHDLRRWLKTEQWSRIAKQVLRSGEARNIAISYQTKSGETRQATGSAALIDISGAPCMLQLAMDITDRERAAEAVQESEERLRIAIEAGHMFAFEWDVASDMVQASKHSPRMLDLSNNGTRHTQHELIERLASEDRQSYIRALASLTPAKPDYRLVFRLPLQDGRTAWLEESGRAIFGPDRKLRKVVGITSDVTEVRESERVLRELSGRLITSQEEERRRIARELHDNIGQEAALLCVLAQRIDSGQAEKDRTMHSDVHDLYRRIKVLAADVSRLSHRLHSSELTFLGLEVAAERLCRDFGSQYGIDIDYKVKSLPAKLDGGKSLCLYRVLQEVLQNVGKHSHATKVTVETTVVDHELTLEVRDNGEGFDVEKTGFDAGIGLFSMRERLNFVGGSFNIASRHGSGTTVIAKVRV